MCGVGATVSARAKRSWTGRTRLTVDPARGSGSSVTLSLPRGDRCYPCLRTLRREYRCLLLPRPGLPAWIMTASVDLPVRFGPSITDSPNQHNLLHDLFARIAFA